MASTKVAGRTITKYSIALLVIVLIGIFLRLYHLGTQSFWEDEAFSVFVSKGSLFQICYITATDVHPPLYYWILHYWLVLFGTSEVATRALSALFGVLAIPVIYMLGDRLFNKEAGLLAALILAFSTFNVAFSQDARMYSLMVLLTLLSMYFFIRFLQGNTLAISVGYLFSTALLLYTHVYGLFIVFAQNIYLLTLLCLSHERTFRLRHWITLQVLVIAFFAGWIPVLIWQTFRAETAGYWVLTPTINDLITTLTLYAGTTILLILFLAISMLSLFTCRELRGSVDWKAPVKAFKSCVQHVSLTKDYKALYFLAVWLLAINVIPFAISLFSTSFYFPRFTIAGSVALYLIVAKGITHINFRYAKLAIIIVVVALLAANLQTYYTTPTPYQARETVGFINENAKNEDLVLFVPNYGSAVLYYGLAAGLNVTTIVPWSGNASNVKQLQLDINGHNRVWVVEEMFSEGNIQLPQTMEILKNASYNRISEHYFGWYAIYLFEKQGQSLGGYLTSAPAATSPSSGVIDVFVRGSDNALWWRYGSGQDWSTWTSLGGVLTADPAATSQANGAIDVFVRGSAGDLWQKEYNNGVWGAWTPLGGVLAPGTGPAACSWGAGRLDVFVEGADGALWHQGYNGAWSGWESRGGYLTASPAATSPASGVIDVFARGSDSALWQKSYSSGWSGWNPLGGQIAPGTGPAACSWGPYRLDVSVKGTDGALWHQKYDGSSRWGWQSLGGYLTASPAATSPASGMIDVFVRGSTGELWWMTYYN